jgi:dihydrofolate synthase/folylpolyglutamate synthase
LPLLGRHQLDNAATAVLALEALAERTGSNIDAKAARDGFANLRWPARIETLKRHPLIIADGAHNADSARQLVRTLQDDLRITSALLIVGASRDKAIETLAAELAPVASEVIATQSRNPRAADARDVMQAFAAQDVPVLVQGTVAAALDAATAQSAQGGTIVACGSLFVAAEAREHILGITYDPPLAPANASRKSEVLA